MLKYPGSYLTKREHQIMDIIYQRERVTAAELEAALSGAPANSTVRTQLRVLERKGHLRHEEVEGRFVYLPTHARPSAARAALDSLLDTFFSGSVEQAFATLLSSKAHQLTKEDLDRLAALVEQAKEEGE